MPLSKQDVSESQWATILSDKIKRMKLVRKQNYLDEQKATQELNAAETRVQRLDTTIRMIDELIVDAQVELGLLCNKNDLVTSEYGEPF